MANANLIAEAIQQLLLKQSKMSKAELAAEALRTNELRKEAIRNRIAKTSAGKTALPEKTTGGDGPDPYDSFTPEGAQGFADPKLSLDESIAKELDEIELGPTISKRRKQELKQSKNVEDKKELYKATTGQQGKQDGRPYSVHPSLEDSANEQMTLDRILSSEIDKSLDSRANAAGRVSNQNQSVQNLRNKSQLDNLDRSSDEQKILDKANEVLFNVNKAAEKNPALSGGQNKYSNTPTTVFNREGPTKIKARVGEVAKRFGQNEDLNADIQDMYSRLDEMFPGFKKGTPDSDEFFELDAKGKRIPGAKLQGGKDASMASRLNDTKKKLANLAQRARMIRNVANPSKSDLQLLARIKAELDKIDNEYFGTKSTQETRQLGNTINPESNVPSVKQFNDEGTSYTDFVAPNRTDAGVEFRQGPTRRKAEQALGPKMSPTLEALKRRQTGFNPKNIGAPPTQSPLESEIQQMLMNVGK
tara:strand:- start:10649 stop:12073 length:1425 start_codon:yes stop_codon:yes gene_type:complete